MSNIFYDLEKEIKLHVSKYGPLKKVSEKEVKDAVAKRRDEYILAWEKKNCDDILILEHEIYRELGGVYSETHYFIGGNLILNEPLWDLIQEEIKNIL